MTRPIWFRSNSPTHRWLSNFWPTRLEYGPRISAESAEHLYQALKFEDGTAPQQLVLRAPTALAAMRIGRRYPVRDHWNRDEVMESVLWTKFSQSVTLHRALIQTGDVELKEANGGYWGALNGGANRLGQMLEALRKSLRDSPLDDGRQWDEQGRLMLSPAPKAYLDTKLPF